MFNDVVIESNDVKHRRARAGALALLFPLNWTFKGEKIDYALIESYTIYERRDYDIDRIAFSAMIGGIVLAGAFGAILFAWLSARRTQLVVALQLKDGRRLVISLKPKKWAYIHSQMLGSHV